MNLFDRISIIYDPRTESGAPKAAKDLADGLNGQRELIKRNTIIVPVGITEDVESNAESAASGVDFPLIISVGGDGNFNHVVNGVMSAKNKSKTKNPVVSRYVTRLREPAAQFNSHATPLIRLIGKARPIPLSLIEINIKQGDIIQKIYAHRYISIGISSENTQVLIKRLRHFNPLRRILSKTGKSTIKVINESNESANYQRLLWHIKDDDIAHDHLKLPYGRIIGRQTSNLTSFTLEQDCDILLDGEVKQLKTGAKLTIKYRQHALNILK